jgi:hypothetical protein
MLKRNSTKLIYCQDDEIVLIQKERGSLHSKQSIDGEYPKPTEGLYIL